MARVPTIRYRFERIPISLGSTFERYAQAAQYVVRNAPLALEHFSFATSAGAVNALLGINCGQYGWSPGESFRPLCGQFRAACAFWRGAEKVRRKERH